jgi:hypothetical protein
MFSDTQTVTVNAVAKNLPRVGFGDRAGSFELEDSSNVTWKLSIAHILRNRNRRTVRLDISKIAADPFQADLSRPYSMSVYLVIDAPKTGFTAVEVSQNVQGLIDYLDTPANLAKVIGGES